MNRVIFIDDYGTLPFLIMAKNKGIVVAQISDFHSSRMTIQHNNPNVLSLGYKIIAKKIWWK
ncbi:RpiB/LacA/LacB family sugar-phosphate isomerase [Spiroplasma taiwanense]|uniref:RpiB/LacA/LacB family sugar-phosphate isomerase n=1 Tax=Spiroplasma taiwanense TaxID=2145 RepID=UPI000A0661D9|nr:RpiB/LacA/LacB family sugar-phosphate isomerase [Spiroplasma taiwanense]